jgi:hypothetical protein
LVDNQDYKEMRRFIYHSRLPVLQVSRYYKNKKKKKN